MAGPITALRFVHSAILAESERIDEVVAAASSREDLASVADDVALFEELVLAHTRGEEIGMFPVLAALAPHIDETYLLDHEDERATFTRLGDAIADGDLPAAQRAAVTLDQHAHAHIRKENTLIVPFVEEHLSAPEQGAMLGKILSTIPPERNPVFIPWILERISGEDAAAYATVLEGAMPPEVFTTAKGWIRNGVSAATWAELSARLPHLADS